MATYHPRFHDLGRIISKNLIHFYGEEQAHFTPAPFVSFRSGFSLKNLLVRAKVYTLLREKLSSCVGKSRCETCFRFGTKRFGTKKVYKNNHHFHCDSNCIVYLLSCKVFGLQYVGSTVNRLRLR